MQVSLLVGFEAVPEGPTGAIYILYSNNHVFKFTVAEIVNLSEIYTCETSEKARKLYFNGSHITILEADGKSAETFFPHDFGIETFFWWFRTYMRSSQNKNFLVNIFFTDGHDFGLFLSY